MQATIDGMRRKRGIAGADGTPAYHSRDVAFLDKASAQ